jgi:hypothetical protein
MSRPVPSTSFRTLGLWLSVTLVLLGCGQSIWPDRQASIVEDIRVDSLKFVPRHARYILKDSLTSIHFKGYHLGYGDRIGHECSKVFDMHLEVVSASRPNTFGPKTRIRLPSDALCPIETSGRDTVLTKIFNTQSDSSIHLVNSSGIITDSVQIVQGQFSVDSLSGVPDGLARTISLGRWTFLDSTSQTPRRLFADSLSSCEFLNQGTYATNEDTVKVRLSLVTLDSTSVVDRCHGPKHQEEIILNLFSALKKE